MVVPFIVKFPPTVTSPNVCVAVHVFALPRFIPSVLAAEPSNVVPLANDSVAPADNAFVVTLVALPLDAAVILPFESTVILALVYEAAVTAVLASVRVIAVVPDPDASPLTVMVWLPDRYDPVSSAHVSAAVFLRNPEVPARPAIAVRSASRG